MKRMSFLFALAHCFNTPVTLIFLKEFFKSISSKSMQLVHLKCSGSPGGPNKFWLCQSFLKGVTQISLKQKAAILLLVRKYFPFQMARSPGDLPFTEQISALFNASDDCSVTLDKHFHTQQFQILPSNIGTMNTVDMFQSLKKDFFI